MGTIELVYFKIYYQGVLVASLISYRLNYLENSCDDELLLKE